MSFYVQMVGEDEAGAFPARKSWLLGSDWTTSFGQSQQQCRYLEYTNTTADDLFGSPMPNITYDHSTYHTGYRYRGRNMASTFEGDAEAATLGAYNFFPNGHNLGIAITWADVNRDGASRVAATDPEVFKTCAYVPARTGVPRCELRPAGIGWLG